MNGGISELLFEKIVPKFVFGVVAGGLDVAGALFDGDPSQIATGEMIPWRAGFTTLAFGTAHQLLEFAMQLLDVPAHGVFGFHVVSGQS